MGKKGATRSRHLDWEGCFNARDLGGLPTTNGATTRWGAAIRADSLAGLTTTGWAALVAHGVRTVVDLRNDDELGDDAAPRAREVTTIHVPLDGKEDRGFWDEWDCGPQFGTPLYYLPHLERMPERSVAVLTAIARAEPGGVAFHCGAGRDRAGLVTMLLLALAGVSARDIAADYALSPQRLTARYSALGEVDEGPLLDAFLTDRGTTGEALIVATLAGLEVEGLVCDAGLTAGDVAALRRRLVQEPGA
jgi:protein-tyrosine phosphatase